MDVYLKYNWERFISLILCVPHFVIPSIRNPFLFYHLTSSVMQFVCNSLNGFCKIKYWANVTKHSADEQFVPEFVCICYCCCHCCWAVPQYNYFEIRSDSSFHIRCVSYTISQQLYRYHSTDNRNINQIPQVGWRNSVQQKGKKTHTHTPIRLFFFFLKLEIRNCVTFCCFFFFWILFFLCCC